MWKMTKFITDQMMEEALDFLAMSSEHLAQARANRVRAEHARKRVRANLILNSLEKSVVLREADAETDQRYAEAVDAECEMIRLDEYYRAERNRCDAIIEAWRSEQANARAGQKFQ
jgi:hypothetical protein